MAKLLKEINEDVRSFFVEEILDEKTGIKSKGYFIEGVFLQGNIKNHNSRIYDPQILAKECVRYQKENIDRNRGFGELGHPDTPQINFERVSHLIKELRQEGDNFYGKAKIIDTPMGKIAKTLIDENAQLGVSSRGTGSLSQYGPGIMAVGADFRLATVDIVSNPSAPEAWVRNVFENVDFYFESETGSWFPQWMEKKNNQINKMSIKKLEEQKIRLFEQYLEKLSKAIV